MVNLFVAIVTKYLDTNQVRHCKNMQHRKGKNNIFLPYGTENLIAKVNWKDTLNHITIQKNIGHGKVFKRKNQLSKHM